MLTHHKFALLAGLLLLCCTLSWAQIDSNKILDYLRTEKFAIDTEANAIVLYESTHIDVSVEYEKAKEIKTIHRIIKILNTEGLREANIKVRYNSDDDLLDIYDIKGTTYNLAHNTIKTTLLPTDDLYKTKLHKKTYETGFSMPDVKAGRIIDYTYTLESPLSFMLPTWEIQEEIPKLYTEYAVTHSNKITYTVVLHTKSNLKELNNEADIMGMPNDFCHFFKQTFADKGNNYTIWARKNVPAIKKEPFVINLNNYKERMDLQIKRDLLSKNKSTQINTWDKYNEKIWQGDLAKNLRNTNSFLEDTVNKIVNNNTDKLLIAKAIYSYVRNNYQLSNNNKSIVADLKSTFNKREGNEAQINAVLIAMLHKAGLEAYMLMASTTKTVSAAPEYPVVNRLNYLAAVIILDGTFIYLDASAKYTPFGMLPLSCYNGYARIISEIGMYTDLSPDLLEDNNHQTVKITYPNETTKQVEITKVPGMVSSYRIRKEIATEKGNENMFFDKYIAKIAGGANVIDKTIENIDKPEDNLIIKTTYKTNIEPMKDGYLFNTEEVNVIHKNPFIDAIRNFPIEYQNKINDNYILSVALPKGFKIETIPKPCYLTIGENTMEYRKTMAYLTDTNLLKVVISFKDNQVVYSKDKYNAIRSFYEDVIKDENKVIEFIRK